MNPTLSVTLPVFGRDAVEPGLLETARAAEAAGFDRLVVPDHVVMGPGSEPYPWGTLPGPPADPWLEPLTVLAAVAGATSRVRLATSVLIAPLRPPAVLAKTAATLDVLSGGRLDLGVGTGWQRAEYEAAGVPWRGRGRRLSDTLAACRALWRDSPASFASETVSFRGVYCEPRPLQPDGVPLWIAGAPHARTLHRLTAWGAGWIPLPGAKPDQVASGVALARSAWAAAGRDPAALQVQATLALLEEAPAYVAAGATTIRIGLPPRDRMRETVERFAALTRG